MNADPVVKGVLLLLLAASVWSWAVIIDKLWRLGAASRAAREHEARAASARSLKLGHGKMRSLDTANSARTPANPGVDSKLWAAIPSACKSTMFAPAEILCPRG